MKIKLTNLGPLNYAEFEPGDLTLICGHNNTGKTYATYALYGFLALWEEYIPLVIPDAAIDQILQAGVLYLPLQDYQDQAQALLEQGCKAYTQNLSKIFAAQADRFSQTRFQVIASPAEVQPLKKYQRQIGSETTAFFSITKETQSDDLVVTLLVNQQKQTIPREILKEIISKSLRFNLFRNLLPRPFIISAERTGSAIFRQELNFSRNRLLEKMAQSSKDINPMELLFQEYEDYALPIQANVEFTRKLEIIAKKTSFIAKDHPGILEEFGEIIGGSYTVTGDDELYYSPKGKKSVKLSMDESSSAVRSLLDLGFYLRHEAQPTDWLLMDEPELNLHPANQQRLARLLARLVNLGMKVLITTHSDYIVREFNTLIMLNQPDDEYLQGIAQEEGYDSGELLEASRVRVYIAEAASVMLPGKKRKTKGLTLTPAEVSPTEGIDARSFDPTIEEMNRIQGRIFWREV